MSKDMIRGPSQIKTGRIVWTHTGVNGALSIADGKLLIQSGTGELIIAEASPEGYQPLASTQLLKKPPCWTPPVLCGGLLYCRSGQGKLVCLDLRLKPVP